MVNPWEFVYIHSRWKKVTFLRLLIGYWKYLQSIQYVRINSISRSHTVRPHLDHLFVSNKKELQNSRVLLVLVLLLNKKNKLLHETNYISIQTGIHVGFRLVERWFSRAIGRFRRKPVYASPAHVYSHCKCPYCYLFCAGTWFQMPVY